MLQLLTLVCSVIVAIGGVVGVIKPTTIIGKKKLASYSDQEIQKKLKNARIISIGWIVLGLLLFFTSIA